MSFRRVKIESVYEGLYDGPHATPKPSDSGPVFLGIGNITPDGQLDLSDVRHIAEEDYAAWTKRVVPEPGDIVFTYEATLNRYAIIPQGFRGCLGRRLALIRPDSAKVNPRFLFLYFFGQDWRNTISGNILSGATVDRIPLTKFPEFEVNLPPRPVQDKIADILSAYDDLFENNNRRIKILEQVAEMLYREWFVNFRFPGHEKVKMVESEIGLIPRGWKVMTVAGFGTVVTGKTPSTERTDYFGGDIPFIKTPDMHGNIFCLQVSESLSLLGAKSQKNKLLPKNSLIVNCIGALAGSVSITTRDCQTNQQINAVVLTDHSTREYLYLSLVGLRDALRQIGSNGATMINVNKTKFEGLQVKTPPEELMLQFHALTYPLFESIKNLHLKNINLKQTRDLLLPKLVSGEISVEQIETEALAETV
jgi:type I restriction enzyme S subunit